MATFGQVRPVDAFNSATENSRSNAGSDTETSGYARTLLLTVPVHTTIQPHRDPDDRVATVISGTWKFSYSPLFGKKALKALPPDT